MLIQGLERSQRDRVIALSKIMNGYAEKRKTSKKSPLENEISFYDSSKLLRLNKSKIIDYYFALSVATLRLLSDRCHSDTNPKYDRCISSHETVIGQVLNKEYGLPVVRQLLIGGSHSDFYLPDLHVCIEPSSERYFSKSSRVRSEDITAKTRYLMNDLQVIPMENYYRTSKTLKIIIEGLKRERPRQDTLGIQNNLFTMACSTLPRFISCKDLSLLVMNNPIHTENPI